MNKFHLCRLLVATAPANRAPRHRHKATNALPNAAMRGFHARDVGKIIPTRRCLTQTESTSCGQCMTQCVVNLEGIHLASTVVYVKSSNVLLATTRRNTTQAASGIGNRTCNRKVSLSYVGYRLEG
jgi:nitrous oxidase accessory protein NosD